MIFMNGDYEWFMQSNLDEYTGKWIAIVNKRIVATSENVTDVLKKVREEYPKTTPFVTKVPEKMLMVV